MITLAERVANLAKELLECARTYDIAAEIDAQRQSWVRGMTARCEHDEVDFEQCAKCRGWS